MEKGKEGGFPLEKDEGGKKKSGWKKIKNLQ